MRRPCYVPSGGALRYARRIFDALRFQAAARRRPDQGKRCVSHKGEILISRRAVLRVTALGGAGLLIMQPSAAFGAASSDSLEKRPGSIDAYVAATATAGFTDLAGIHAEYRDAVRRFPFDLPDGWTFPPESSLRDILPSTGSRGAEPSWQRGNGYAEAYVYWQSAVATAACEAHSRGDLAGVERFLNALESGYKSKVRRAVLEDPEDGFLKIEVNAARRGDFAGLSYSAAH